MAVPKLHFRCERNYEKKLLLNLVSFSFPGRYVQLPAVSAPSPSGGAHLRVSRQTLLSAHGNYEQAHL